MKIRHVEFSHTEESWTVHVSIDFSKFPYPFTFWKGESGLNAARRLIEFALLLLTEAR